MTPAARSRRAGTAVAAAVALLTACSGAGAPAGAPSTGAPTRAATSAPRSVPTSTPGINLRPPGELDAATVRDLMVDFDERLSRAYAAGDPSHLSEFLAGTELRGHTSSIQVLTSRHRRNVFHVVVDSVTITSNSPQRVVLVLQDHTTDNHFVDTTTNQVLDQGFPGPAAQSFTIFLDYNPENHTWYWTGGIDNGGGR